MKVFCGLLALSFLVACGPSEAETSATHMTQGGIPARGETAIGRYGCGACHTIPGIEGASGLAGPSLEHIASRLYIGGHLQNTPEHLMSWIQHPQKHDPRNVMPEMGVTTEDARDIAAFLYTLR